MVLDIISIAASLVTALGLVSLIYIMIKWICAPKFLVGVLPIDKSIRGVIKQLGEPSFFDEMYFNRQFLAKKIKTNKQLSSLENDESSSKDIREKDGKIELPIIIQNIGKRDASSYSVGITYSGCNLGVIDLKTETLAVDGLYVQDQKSFVNKHHISRIPSAKIRALYKLLGLTRDYISLRGALGSQTFEMIYLTLKIPRDCKDFTLIFRIDCPDAFLRRSTRAQHIRIAR